MERAPFLARFSHGNTFKLLRHGELQMSSPPISISHRLFRCRCPNSKDVVASSPFFSCPAARAPRGACSPANKLLKSPISFPTILSFTVHICLARYLIFFRFLFLYSFLFLFFSIFQSQVAELRVNCIHPSKNSLVNAGNYLYGRGGEKNYVILEETGLFREISMTKHFYEPFLRS